MPAHTFLFDTYFTPPEPVIAVTTTDSPAIFPMLIDTGAHRTTFPSKWAPKLGHDNQAPGVSLGKSIGVGGLAVHYIHTVNIIFLDNELIPIWETGHFEAVFSDKMDRFNYGLIGRDLCCQKWNKLILDTSSPEPRNWTISIEFPD